MLPKPSFAVDVLTSVLKCPDAALRPDRGDAGAPRRPAPWEKAGAGVPSPRSRPEPRRGVRGAEVRAPAEPGAAGCARRARLHADRTVAEAQPVAGSEPRVTRAPARPPSGTARADDRDVHAGLSPAGGLCPQPLRCSGVRCA